MALLISLDTPSGIHITDAGDRLERFLAKEWRYYDGMPDPDPDHLTMIDILAPVMVNAYIGSGANRIAEIEAGLRATVEPLLASIPADADLRATDVDLAPVRAILAAAITVRGVLAPVATKVLHRKRRSLIPILDNVVLAHYLTTDGPARLPGRTQDKARAAGAANTRLG